MGPIDGPLPAHLPVTQQLLNVNEAATLLLFHPSSVLDNPSAGGKLPLSIYEAFYEPGSEKEDKSTQIDKLGMGRELKLKYRTLDYSMDTGEAEMIGMDFVARGAGNATAVPSTSVAKATGPSDASKGKAKASKSSADINEEETETLLSPEDEEGWYSCPTALLSLRLRIPCANNLPTVIAQLTAKANAIKMLHQRINLIKAYLTSLPPSYLSDSKMPISSSTPELPNSLQPQINHSILRSIQALLNRLALLIPANRESFDLETSQQKSDVALVELLGSVTQSLQDAREMGRKFAVVESARNQGRKGTGLGIGSHYESGRPGAFLE